MRLSFAYTEQGPAAVVLISERNLVTLLHKLGLAGSSHCIRGDDCPSGWALLVIAQSDQQHYDGRPEPAGPMLAPTELAIQRWRQACEN